MPIGTADLGNLDPNIDLVTGTFHPFPGYTSVEPMFQEFSSLTLDDSAGGDVDEQSRIQARMEDLRQAWKSLDLRLETTNGRTIKTDWIDIKDYAHELEGDDTREVMVCIHSFDEWEELFGHAE